MPYSDYRPEFMGSATLEPSGRFEAGSYQSFTLTYTAGRFGIDDTGSIKIGFRFATDFGPVQFDDPEAARNTCFEDAARLVHSIWKQAPHKTVGVLTRTNRSVARRVAFLDLSEKEMT